MHIKIINTEIYYNTKSFHLITAVKLRRLRWAGHVTKMEEGRRIFYILAGKSTRKKPLGRLRCRWEDNIRIDFKEIGSNTRNWIDSAQDRDYC